jgi:hypothetical protein
MLPSSVHSTYGRKIQTEALPDRDIHVTSAVGAVTDMTPALQQNGAII